MSEFFLMILNMSISASWIVFAVFLMRILLKRAPKWIAVLLWAIVALRLICPVSIESEISLIPSAQTVDPLILTADTPQIFTGFASVNNFVNPVVQDSFARAAGESANPLQIWTFVAALVWIGGILALLIYSAVSCLRLKRKVATAVLLRENIFQSENITAPFVLGARRPIIYLPLQMKQSDVPHVIAHEQAHIRRKDHLWKPMGFAVLTVHWFNPLVWLGYVLLCRDIEMACDEKVVRGLGACERADYSQALLNCSVGRRMIAACPLAFGEVSVKQRVKSVLCYKKPALWLIATALAAIIALAFCFLTNPASERLQTIEESSFGALAHETVDVWHSDGETYHRLGAVDQALLHDLLELEISREEISKNRAEDRDRSNTLVLQTAQDAEPTFSSYLKGLYIHFSADFTSVWVHDGVKPTLTYRVSDPQKAKETYGYIAGYNMKTPATQILDMQALKAKYPMYYFGPNPAKGVEVYIWQMAETSYSCGALPGRNRNYTPQEIWSLHKNPVSLEEMKTIIASQMAEGIIKKEDVAIIPVSMPHSSYAYVIDEAYSRQLTALFWNEPIRTVEGNFRTYYEMGDGTWKYGDHTYKYRLEITGRMPMAVADSTYVYLSNLESISFQRAMLAAGLSSSMNDYFAPEEAVLVELWTHEEEKPTGYPDGEIDQPQIRYNGLLYFYFATGFAEALPKGYIYAGAVEAVDNKKTPQNDFCGARVEVGQKIYTNETIPETIYVKYENGYAKFTTEGP